MEVPLKTKNRATIWPGNPTTEHIPRENQNLKRYMHPMFMAALFTVARTWKQPITINTWMDRDVVHMYNGILLSHKNSEIMPFAATWMDLENSLIWLLTNYYMSQCSLLWVHPIWIICVSWIWMYIYLIFGKISAIISFNKIFTPSSPGSPIMHTLIPLLVSHKPLRLYSLFFIPFLVVFPLPRSFQMTSIQVH